MSVNYKTVVDWDPAIADAEYTDTDTLAPAMQGLVQTAVKTTTGAPSASLGAGKYMIGALVQNAVDGLVYRNVGTVAVPVFTTAGGGGVGTVSQVLKVTNGTTPVAVFGTPSGVAGTILSITVQALDTTAGNIIVKDTAGTVATIAKGTVIGVITPAGAIANAAFTAAGILTIESSTAGNAIVTINYTPA